MKLLFLLLPLSLFSGVTVFAETAQTPISENILYEGGFIENSSGTPKGWYQSGFAGGDHGNTVTTTEDRGGNYVSLFIKNVATGNFNLSLANSIHLKPTWKELHCGYDIRVYNLIQGPESYHKSRMNLTFFDAEGKELLSTSITFSEKLLDTWQTVERNVPIPAGATSAKLWIGTLASSGQIDFRNLYISPRP